MSDEWVEKRVADLAVGDEVRDSGTVLGLSECPSNEGWWDVRTDWCKAMWPAHARVDVRRPVDVTVNHRGTFCDVWVGHLLFGKEDLSHVEGYNAYVATFRFEAHAEEYAERLRGSADERAKALGETS